LKILNSDSNLEDIYTGKTEQYKAECQDLIVETGIEDAMQKMVTIDLDVLRSNAKE
jgi:hypothetical protein